MSCEGAVSVNFLRTVNEIGLVSTSSGTAKLLCCLPCFCLIANPSPQSKSKKSLTTLPCVHRALQLFECPPRSVSWALQFLWRCAWQQHTNLSINSKNIFPLNGWHFWCLNPNGKIVKGVNYISAPIHVYSLWLTIDFPSMWWIGLRPNRQRTMCFAFSILGPLAMGTYQLLFLDCL